MKVLLVKTKDLGDLEISFQHYTGDADVELRRLLTGYHVNQNAAGVPVRDLVQKDLEVLARISKIERVHILVDVGDRRTLAFIRPAKDNEVMGNTTTYTGIAYVNPVDQYKKEEGRFLALNRAIDEMGVSEAIRREILSGYFNR